MTRKKEYLSVDADLSDFFSENERYSTRDNNFEKGGFSILQALEIIAEQMEIEGRRPRTIIDYEIHVTDFARKANINDLEDITSNSIYSWLSSMKVANSTKLIRIKCLRAFLERCLNNRWLPEPFWRNISVKVHTPIKQPAAEKDIAFLLSMLDLSDFVELRDAAAILTLYQTGIRVETAAKLRESNVDLSTKCLRIGGDIMKNHDALILPFDDRLAKLFEVLIKQNAKVRQIRSTRNDFLFITQGGNGSQSTPTNNNIAKRINKYRREFGLENVSPHALRRAFANNLYRRSNNNISLVSKALGHSNLAVTTRYLHLDAEDVAEGVRKYL